MRLKRIRLNGFKSFCDDTVFDFKEHGITMIVGPNGCGKSNVVDAIRWVLGEQSPRQLRGSAMADVIFAGSVSRAPVNRCEVTLIFDNTDGAGLEKYREYGEIAVTRRLYRSGDSDYLINKTPCRLMDVRDLVMDTGAGGRSYSIVEQGKVDEFITASPIERRIFMEEAAGIVRYKTRRIAAERKLDQTHQNLLRVTDVLAELQRQEESLRGQMEKAREYLDLKAEVGEMARMLLHVRLQRSTSRCATLEGELGTAQQQHEALRQTLSIGETALERINLDLVTLEGRLREERARVCQQERDIQSHETRQALSRQNLEHSRRWIQETTRAREELQAQRVTLDEELQGRHNEAQAAERDAEALRIEITGLEAQHGEKEALRKQLQGRLQDLQEGLVECHSSLAGIRNQRQMLQERGAEGDRRAQGMRTQIETTDAELRRADELATGQSAQLDALRQTAGEHETRHAALSATAAQLAGEAAALGARLETVSRECVSLTSRLDSLAEIQSSYEGFGESVRNALRWLDETPGVRERYGVVGPLADVVSLPPEAVDWAGAYLAPFLEILLIRDSAHLPALHAALRDAGFGGVRLWALDNPTNGNGNGAAQGKQRFADVLAVDGAHEPVRSGLFGAVQLTDGTRIPLPAADAGGGHGEWLAADGAYHIDAKRVFTVGGAPAPSVGILRRRGEIDALQGQLQSAQAARGEVATAHEALAVKQAATEEAIAALTSTRNEQALILNRLESELAHQVRERQRLQTVLQTQNAELEQFIKDLAGYAARSEELGREETDWSAKRDTLEQELGGLRSTLDAAAAEAAELGNVLTGRKVARGQSESNAAHLQARCEALARDGAATQARLETIGTELARHEQQVAEHTQELETVRTALQDLHAGLSGLQQQVRERQIIYDKQLAERDHKQERIGGDKRQTDVLGARLHELELALTEERMRREQWQQQLDAQLQAAAEAGGADEPLQETALPDAHAEPAPEPGEQVDVAALEKKLDAARVRLERMAGVNLAAWEEYESLNSRAETMLHQQDDLEAAINDLKESIRQMNQESRRRFKETFEAVNAQFQILFPQIFGGGEASLVLTDTEDLLLSGVDIAAQPPGKKLQSMNLLSGGEKALTAIAMIFAFFLTKPSPYCLLDEVDAPLDDVNVGRFNRLVEGMTDRSQFIMITHNKRTMEIGDVLYGVTMEESGVSKVVSVDLGRS